MAEIVWTEIARSDLKEVHDYISTDSSTYASRVVEKILGRTTQLQSFPKSGRVVPEFQNENIRELIE